MANEKICNWCKETIRGRSDKKFCNDYCRNAFNNQNKPITNKIVKEVNSILIKNRKILEMFVGIEKDTGKTTKQQLLQLGFLFSFFTNTYTNRTGKTYYYCYDYGYLPLDHNWYLIVKQKNSSEKLSVDHNHYYTVK